MVQQVNDADQMVLGVPGRRACHLAHAGAQAGSMRPGVGLPPAHGPPAASPISKRKIAALSDHPEDCLHGSLTAMVFPRPLWSDYLSAQLAALPGWAGFIRWRADQGDYPWQRACPVNLVQYLAVRQWYECELVSQACRAGPAATTLDDISAALQECLRPSARRVTRFPTPCLDWRGHLHQARVLHQADPGELEKLAAWQDEFSEPHHGPVWLEAFEATWQAELLTGLARTVAQPAPFADCLRPESQSIYCIDVRMEPFRRHLEALGNP